MRRTWPLLTAAIVLSFAGVYLSGALLGKHMHVPGTPAFLNSLCESESGNLSCDAVLNSRWGVFPPKPEDLQESVDKDAPKPVRIPVAYLGMAYYKSGKTELAKATLQQALQLSQDFPGVTEAREVLQTTLQ